LFAGPADRHGSARGPVDSGDLSAGHHDRVCVLRGRGPICQAAELPLPRRLAFQRPERTDGGVSAQPFHAPGVPHEHPALRRPRCLL
ncbi:unnamed protein product, partial [Ectocarpus sp. 4 AP-2014]